MTHAYTLAHSHRYFKVNQSSPAPILNVLAYAMSVDNDEPWDADVFGVESVGWKVLPTKRTDEVTIRFYDEDGGAFNLIKIWGSLHKLANELASEIEIMEAAEGEH